MKKLFALALVVLGLAACQTDHSDLDVQFDGNATITLSIPADAVTRAGGSNSAASGLDNTDGEKLRFILEIYDENNVKKIRETQYANEGTLTANFPVRLVPGRKYTLVAWADMVTAEGVDNHYITSNGLTEITLNGDWNAMDETRDAFTAKHYIESYSGSSTLEMKLTRPFAKLRVIANDVADIARLGLTATHAKVDYTVPVATSYNAFEQKVKDTDNRAAFTFNIAEYDDSKDGKLVLYTDYIFANEAQGAVKFTLTTYEDAECTKQIKEVNFNTDIPVQRNMLTTLIGNVLTEGSNIEVAVDKKFGSEKNWPDENNINEQLAYAAIFGGEVTLSENVTLTETLTIADGANVVINLGNYTISGHGVDAEGNKVHSIVNNGKLTINGGTVKSITVNGGSAIYNYGTLELNGTTINGAPTDTANGNASYALNTAGVGSKLVVNNTTINGRGVIGATNGTKVEINGGTYHTPAVAWGHAIYANGEGTEVVVNGGTFSEGYAYDANNWGMYQIYSGNKAKVIVKGGDFSQPWDCANGYDLCTATEGTIEIYGGTFADDPSKQNGKNYLAPGYYALQYETGKYTVQAFDAAARSFTINSKEDFLKLNTLNDKWNEFFSNGQGTDITDFWTQNGGKGADFYYKWEWTIKLNADIDFEGATLNAPIKMAGFGCFDGQNHTIKNVTIENDTDAGLFISSGYGALKNIKLDNVHAIGGYGGNSTVGILASDCSAGIDNITITNSSANGGKYTGGVVGYGYTYVTNCTLTNCVVKGGYKCGGVIGYICASNATGHNVTGNTLTNCTVAEAPQHADNKTEYVLGMVVGNYNCNGTCADNVVYDMTTTATKIIGKIEGGMVVNEYNNVVYENIADGVRKVNEDYEISSKAGMFWFANEVNTNGNAFTGKTVKLTADIDLNNKVWIPVGQTGATTFNGVFDGQNFTISNLNVNSEAQTGENYSSGLFGWVESHTAGCGHIKNVKINGANIVGHHNCGALVGFITEETALVENCHVTGATISCTKANNDADGDKAGALIGNATVATPVKDCTAANSTVSAGRDAGQVIGAGKEANVTGCSATNVTVSANGTGTGANVRNEVIGRLLN